MDMNEAEILLMIACAIFALSAAVLRVVNGKKFTHSRPYDGTGTRPQQSRLDGGSG
jgi:hypothetical protein